AGAKLFMRYSSIPYCWKKRQLWKPDAPCPKAGYPQNRLMSAFSASVNGSLESDALWDVPDMDGKRSTPARAARSGERKQGQGNAPGLASFTRLPWHGRARPP